MLRRLRRITAIQAAADAADATASTRPTNMTSTSRRRFRRFRSRSPCSRHSRSAAQLRLGSITLHLAAAWVRSQPSNQHLQTHDKRTFPARAAATFDADWLQIYLSPPPLAKL
jgi:hypothetical protein